jgi:hypothetical protein
MKKIIFIALICSGCAAEVKENNSIAEGSAEAKTYMPFYGKYVHNEAGMLRSFLFKENNVVEVEVVPGTFETSSYKTEGDHIKVVMEGGTTMDFTIKNDKELISGHGIGAEENFVYVKETAEK